VRKSQRLLTTALSILVSLAVVVYVVVQLDWQETIYTFTHLKWVWLVIALLVFGVNYVLRTLRFRMLIYTQAAPFRQLMSVTCLYGMFNYLLPAKSGEISYLYLVNRRLGVSLGESSMNLLAARFFDFLTIALFLPTVLIVFWQRLPSWMIYTSLLFCGLIYALGLGLVWFLKRPALQMDRHEVPEKHWRVWLQRFWHELVEGLRLISQQGQYGRLALLTIGIWLCVYTNFYFIVLSLGYRLNYFQMIVISIIMVPLTLLPVQGLANLGTHEAGWLAAFAIFGQPQETALTVAVGSHIILLWFVLILGGLGLLLGMGSKRYSQRPARQGIDG
jgi:uncharacterized protein (TIRG00374 family)